MNVFTDRLRTAVIIGFVLTAAVGSSLRLMKIQVVEHQEYAEKTPYTYTAEQIIHAVRGEIEDVTGKPLVKNEIGFNIIINKVSFPSDDEKANEVLLKTANFLISAGVEYNDSLPISSLAPFKYTTDDEDKLSTLKSKIGLNVYATADNCIDKFAVNYNISDKYTLGEKRIISGLRYEMMMKDFSLSNVFVLSENIDKNLVSKIKELSVNLPGIEISEYAIRTNPVVDVIPHEIGTVGPIYAEEYEELMSQGYLLSDTVGKNGIEKGMEKYLRGENGICEITIQNSEVISSEVIEPATPGNTIRLTVNSGFQKDIQRNFEKFIKYLNATEDDLNNCNAGAVVVLDARNNDVLALATVPTYTLDDYIDDYSEVLNRDNSPALNRATDGLYRPGSAFKTITATAGLNEGFITPYSSYYCNTAYHFYDTTVFCTGWHQYISVSEAIRVSCNVFFYELSRQMGIENIVKYAKLYGLGSELGLESGDTAGYIACPETSEMLGGIWYSGNLLQAGIGQDETKMTPLQMAVAASTIANHGIRYQPHLVDSIYDYLGNKVDDVEPVIAEQITENYDYVYSSIIDGMIGASHNTPEGEYSLNNLGYDVAIKTGTPQTTSSKVTNTTVIGFAPADDPVIAFSVVIENGVNAKYMVRKIIDAYNRYYTKIN